MAGDGPRKREIPNALPSAKENSWSPHDAGQSSRGDSSGLNLKKIVLGAGVVAASGLLGGAEAAALKPEAPGAGAYLAQSTEVVNSKYGRGAGEAPILGPNEKALTTPEVPTPPTAAPDTVTVTKTVTSVEYVTFTQKVANDGSSDEFNPKSFGLGALTVATAAALGVGGAAGAAALRRKLQQPPNRVRDRGDVRTEHGGSSEIELRQQGRTDQQADNRDKGGAQAERRGSSETGLGPGPVDQQADYRAQGL
ncbi:hypothetical protein KSF_053010 [Reticulibacter mediterranei]|uniref:Uncharacterized protein n=1 Tax=Reticulibacter mediterranei TaxID=2778369 RepID=A0A8J3IK49_9CHLR|nr:hypothetical protein [Reticulibacter mediterranei]GHO95253.1 hypothetical protein KSF_053010 [Reticulibacter mediterranei]